MKTSKFISAALAASLAVTGCSGVRDINMADAGKAGFTIICPEDASVTVRFAASELESYLEKITGADFNVSTETSGPSIVVSGSDALAYLSDKDIDGMEGEDYCIVRKKKNIYLAGADDHSVLYAVYDFLEKAGCIWAAPDYDCFEGRAELVPSIPSLKVPVPSKYIGSTLSPYRKLYITSGDRSAEEMKALIEWMPKVKYNIIAYKMQGPDRWELWKESMLPEIEKRDLVLENGGHGYDSFISPGMEDGRLFREHPEWFGVCRRFGKEELGYRSDHLRVIFCISNDDAVKYMLDNVGEFLRTYPEMDIFDFWPVDSEIWCECDKCQAIGTDSDKHAYLVNKVASYMAEEFPEMRLECLAYHFYYEPPVKQRLPENILVDFADYYQNFEHQIYDGMNESNEIHHKAMRKWSEDYGGDVSVYTYFAKGFWRSLPVMIPHYIRNEMLYYRSLGFKGGSVYSEPKNWFTYGLNIYTLAKLAWDPDDDVEKIIGDYCRAVFGEEAETARHAFAEFEDVVRFACVVHQTAFKTDDEYDAYKERLNLLHACLLEKENGLAEGSVLRNHIMRLRMMDEYALKSIDMMIRQRDIYMARKPSSNYGHIVFDDMQGVLTRRPKLEPELLEWLKRHSGLGIFMTATN